MSLLFGGLFMVVRQIRDSCLSRSWTPDFHKKSPGAGSHHSFQCPHFWRLPQEPALRWEEEAGGRRGGGGDGRGQGLQGRLCADVIRLGGLSRPIAAPAGALLRSPAQPGTGTAAASLPAKDTGTGGSPGDCLHPPGRANWPAESLRLLQGLGLRKRS